MAANRSRYEFRWRASNTEDAWGSAIAPADSLSLPLPLLAAGGTFDIQVRSVGTNNVPSDWVSATHTIPESAPASYAIPALASDLAAKGVLDGANLTWTITGLSNTSVLYEIERAPDVTGSPGAFAALGSTRAASYHDAFNTSTKYWYRVRTRADFGAVSPYTNTVSATGTHADDGADVSANAGRILALNPSFDQGDVGWTKGSGWTIIQSGAAPTPMSGLWVAQCTVSATGELLNNAIAWIDYAATNFALTVYYKRTAATGTLRLGVRFFNIGGAVVSDVWTTAVNGSGGTDANFVALSNSGVKAPAGAVSARLVLEVAGQSTGAWFIDNTSFVQTSPWINNLDDVIDGPVSGKVKKTTLNGTGEVIQVRQSGGLVATAELFNTVNDTLDSVAEGTINGKVKKTMLTGGEITTVKRTAGTASVDTLFHKASDTLDAVTDGSSFRKVGTSYVDASNRIANVYDGAAPVAGSTLFQKNVGTLDQVVDGATHKKVAAAYVDGSSRIASVWDGAAPVAGSTLFQKGVHNLDNILDTSVTHKKVAIGSVDGSGRVNAVHDGATSRAGSSLFIKSVSTLDDVVDGSTHKKILAAAVSNGFAKQLLDSYPLRPWDEADARNAYTRIAGLNNVNVTAWESGSPKLIISTTSSAPAYFSLPVLARGSKVLIRYRCNTAMNSVSLYGITSTVSSAGFSFVGDNVDRVVVVDIPSGFSQGETMRLQGLDKDATFEFTYFGSGVPGSGVGNMSVYWPVGTTNQWNYGFNDAVPTARVTIDNKGANQPALSVGDNGLDNTSTYGMVNISGPANTTRGHLALIRSGSYVWQFGYRSGTNTFGIFPWNIGGTNVPQFEMDPGVRTGILSYGNGATWSNEGDFRVGDGTTRLKVGVATAGAVTAAAQGGTNTLALGAGSTQAEQQAIKVVSGVTTITQPSWTAVTFQNSFSNFDIVNYQPAAYFKDSMGVVHLRGLVKRATAGLGLSIFTLPAGSWPAKISMFAAIGNHKFLRMDVNAAGGVSVAVADDASWFLYISLDGINFDTR